MAHFVYTGLKENLPSVREAAFYLCTDTRELYFGENLFTAAVRPYTGEKPTNPAVGILYVNTDTGVGEIYDGSQWIPLIGDIDASNVYFDSDLVFTYQFGKYIPVDGKVTVPAEGKSFKEVLSDAYAEDQMPDITHPRFHSYRLKLKLTRLEHLLLRHILPLLILDHTSMAQRLVWK